MLEGGNHQLVLAGTSSVRGDISIGGAGVTTGAIGNYPTPVRLPLLGQINRGGPGSGLPRVDRERIESLARYYGGLLAGTPPADAARATFSSSDRWRQVADSIDVGYFAGCPDLGAEGLSNRTRPLVVVITTGPVPFPPGIRLRGPLAIVSRDSIAVRRSCLLEDIVLYSAKGISVQACTLKSVQLVAPRLTLDSGVVASYPSAIASLPASAGAPARQSIRLGRGSALEGMVFLDSPFGDDLVTIEASARVTGAVYSTGRVTLDGTVHGTLLTRDFFFYEAPSVYLGWLRSGVVDRTLLPGGFLVPPVFSGERTLSVLAWLPRKTGTRW